MNPTLATRINHITTLQGWCTVEKAQFIADLAMETEAETALELGIFGGRSLIAMAMAFQVKGTGVAWGIDPWTNSAALEGTNHKANDDWWKHCDLESIYRGFLEAILRFNLTNECRWIRRKSEEVPCLFNDGSIDILHIDGNHSEEVSTRDVTLWLPKVKPRGYVILDDINWDSNRKAFDMLKSTGSVIHSTDSWACVRM